MAFKTNVRKETSQYVDQQSNNRKDKQNITAESDNQEIQTNALVKSVTFQTRAANCKEIPDKELN